MRDKRILSEAEKRSSSQLINYVGRKNPKMKRVGPTVSVWGSKLIPEKWKAHI